MEAHHWQLTEERENSLSTPSHQFHVLRAESKDPDQGSCKAILFAANYRRVEDSKGERGGQADEEGGDDAYEECREYRRWARQIERVEKTCVKLEEGRSQKPMSPIIILANHHHNSSTSFPEAKNRLSPPDRVHPERSWENKHLLRSYANGLSFVQIASFSEFSNGLVIHNKAEYRARFEALHQWQLFEDSELLRAGVFGIDENFAQTCSEKFSKGLVKRSEKQIWVLSQEWVFKALLS